MHKRKSFPIHLISPGDQPEQELEQLIAQWANQGEGQVADGRGLWVGQIGRYDLIEGEWTKHHQILNVPTIFNLPYTLDGNETKTEQYSLIGLLCHSGNQHQNGHYFAIFVYRGVYWLVDDTSFDLCRTSTEGIKRQIVQVWALPSTELLPPEVRCEFPSGAKIAEIEQPAKRRCLNGVSFAFANVTNHGATSSTMAAHEATSPYPHGGNSPGS